MAKASVSTGEIVIFEQARGMMEFCILGTTPLICNRIRHRFHAQR